MENHTILVVDDEPAIRRLVKKQLEIAGYSVLLADDGVCALNLFEEHRATVRLLLTDVVMPKMDGLVLADQVLRREPEARIFFMSGSSLNASRGFGCVKKPFKIAELIGKINEVLNWRHLHRMEQPAPAG